MSAGGDNIYIGISVETTQLKEANQLATELYNTLEKLGQTSQSTKGSESGAAGSTEYWREILNSVNATGKEFEELEKSQKKASKPDKSLRYGPDVAPFIRDLDRLNTVAKFNKESLQGIAYGAYLSEDGINALSKATGITVPRLRELGAEFQKAGRNQAMLEAYTRRTRESIGPLGMAFRETTMQLYWASLGFLFFTMTLTRADQAALQKAKTINTLTKSYYNIYKLQKSVTEMEAMYGVNSEEATEATIQLKMAQKDAEIEQKQLANSIKSNILQTMQSVLSLIPLTVNSMYLMVQTFASFKGIMSAGTAGKLYDVQVTQLQNAANIQNAVTNNQVAATKGSVTTATATNTMVMGYQTLAVQKEQVANIGLISTLRQIATLRNLAIPVIGGLIAIGAALGINAYAAAEAERQTQELTAAAREQYGAFTQATEGARNYANELNGNGTVSKDAKAARLEVMALNNELNNLDKSANLDIKATGGNVKNLNVNINMDNVSVREDGDIDTIVNKVYSSLSKEIRGAGVSI